MGLKILIVTKSSDSAGLWWRFKREGHRVMVHFTDDEVKNSMKGVIEPVSLRDGVNQKPDFVLFDMVGNGAMADRLKKAGLYVVGGSQLCDNLELEREYGLKIAEKYGITIPNSKNFSNIKEARAYVQSNAKGVAIKVSGNVSAESSHVAKDAQSGLEYLDYLANSQSDQGTKFVVQDLVKGVEISTEIWLSQGKVIFPTNGTFEEKKLMAGNLGPNTGCMSSCVFPYISSSPKIAQKTVFKILPLLEKTAYSGCMDVNVIVDEKTHEPNFLEFTARLGYSAIYALAATITSNLGEFFHDVSRGTAKRVPMGHSWGSAIRAIIPPAPNEWPDLPEVSKQAYKAIANQVVKFPDDPLIYPLEELGKDGPKWTTMGIDGTVAEACGVGKTLQESWEQAKKRFEKIEVAGKMGRLDGIERAKDDASKLRSWGYDVMSPTGFAAKQFTG